MWTRPRISTISEVKQWGLIKGHWVMLKKMVCVAYTWWCLRQIPRIASVNASEISQHCLACTVCSMQTVGISPARLYVTRLLKVQRTLIAIMKL